MFPHRPALVRAPRRYETGGDESVVRTAAPLSAFAEYFSPHGDLEAGVQSSGVRVRRRCAPGFAVDHMGHRACTMAGAEEVRRMDTRFEALGAYLPSTTVSPRDLIDGMQFEPQFDLQEITGIKTRRVHSKDPETFEDSYVLALLAAKDCLKRSRYKAQELDVIISGSITRYKGGYNNFFEPSFALHLKRALGAHSAIHFDVSNACAGMMTGVQLLDRMIRAGVVRNGMVVS